MSEKLTEAVHTAVRSLHNPPMGFVVHVLFAGIGFFLTRLDMWFITPIFQPAFQPFGVIPLVQTDIEASAGPARPNGIKGICN